MRFSCWWPCQLHQPDPGGWLPAVATGYLWSSRSQHCLYRAVGGRNLLRRIVADLLQAVQLPCLLEVAAAPNVELVVCGHQVVELLAGAGAGCGCGRGLLQLVELLATPASFHYA